MKPFRMLGAGLAVLALLITSVANATGWERPGRPEPTLTTTVLIDGANGVIRESLSSVMAAKQRVAALTRQGTVAQVAVRWPLPTDPTTTEPMARVSSAQRLTNLPTFSWLKEIDVPNDPTLGRGVTVAVIDTGGDKRHQYLRQVMDPGYDIANGDGTPNDLVGHGTHCAGIVHGVAPMARILPVKVFTDTEWADDGTIVAGIDYAIKANVDVISMSIGREDTEKFPAPVLHAALERALKAGIVVVAAAGNANAPTRYDVPGNHPGVIAVEASERGVRTFFSNFATPDDGVTAVTAPGWNIWSSVPNGQFAAMSGTSMACPMVSGAVAALLSQRPKLTRQEVTARLLGLRDQARRWKDDTTPHLNVAELLGTSRSFNLYGQVQDGIVGTNYGANLRGVVISEDGTQVGRTDARGYFALKLWPGTHRLKFAARGYIPMTVDVATKRNGAVRMSRPVCLIPIRSDDALSVVIVRNDVHADNLYGENAVLSDLPEPIGTDMVAGIQLTTGGNAYGVGGYVSGETFGGMGSLHEAPFGLQTRAGIGPFFFRTDFQPVDGFLLAPGNMFRLRVVNLFFRDEVMADPEVGRPSYVLKAGGAFDESGAEVIVAWRNRIVGRFTPPTADPGDVPSPMDFTYPTWEVCNLGFVGKEPVVTPVGTITPPTPIQF